MVLFKTQICFLDLDSSLYKGLAFIFKIISKNHVVTVNVKKII
jgi:hypothetical protein